MRTFVGIAIDDAVRTRIAAFMEQVRERAPQARFVLPDSLHVTLKFIGEIGAKRVSVVERALSGITAPMFSLKIAGTGFFPTPRLARIFWAGVDGGAQLPELATAVDAVLGEVGVDREEEPYRPHISLARAAKPEQGASRRPFAGLQAHLETAAPPDFGSMTARDFVLYESKQSPQGQRYTPIVRFPLGRK